MKDLYRRVGLRPYESSRNKILACKGDFQDTEAACSILLDPNKKAEYDRVYAALTIIATARQRLDVRTSTRWRQTYGDFFMAASAANVRDGNSRDGDQQQTSRGNRFAVVNWKWLAIAAAVVIPAAVALSLLNSGPTPDQPAPRTIVYKQVLESSADVYQEPDDKSQVLDKLERYDKVEVVVEKSTLEWDFVQTDEVSGYVWNEALNIGNNENAYIENCRGMGVARPTENMPLLSLQQGTHQLTVINPLVDDAVFKLRNRSGVDVLAYYIRGNQTVTIDTVPDGTFQFRYATGKNYSTNCHRFLDNMRAMQDGNYREFSSDLWTADKPVVKVSYVLDSASHGFTPIPPRLF